MLRVCEFTKLPLLRDWRSLSHSLSTALFQYLCKNKYHYYSLRFTTHNNSLSLCQFSGLALQFSCAFCMHFFFYFLLLSPTSQLSVSKDISCIYLFVGSFVTAAQDKCNFSSTSCMHHHHSPFIIVSVVPAVRRRPWTMDI